MSFHMAVEGSVMEATFSRNMSLRKLKGLTARNHPERNDNLWCLGPGGSQCRLQFTNQALKNDLDIISMAISGTHWLEVPVPYFWGLYNTHWLYDTDMW